MKTYEYATLMGDDHTLRSGDFFLSYFAFTGIHLVHVLLGTAVLLAVRAHVGERGPQASVSFVKAGPPTGTWSTCCG